MRLYLIGLLVLSGVHFNFARQGTLAVPILTDRVTDRTGTLSESEINSLTRFLGDFEEKTSNQIVVLMVSSLGGESLEEYTISVAEKNKLGKKGRDNGVLLLISKDERRIRIEAGYGLEGALPDAICDQIIRHIMAPKFRNGDFFGGLSDGVGAIMEATKGEFEPDGKAKGMKKFSPLAIIIFILLFGVLPFIFGGGRRRYIGSQGAHSQFPWWWGGFGGGGFGGGHFGGGGFGGGGGFSGGGGSFGGGGASGSW